MAEAREVREGRPVLHAPTAGAAWASTPSSPISSARSSFAREWRGAPTSTSWWRATPGPARSSFAGGSAGPALTNPFRLDAAPADMLTIVLQSASGAIVSGDRIAHRIEAGPGAALHVTSQAATAVHAMPEGTWAEDSGELIVRESAFVELLPEPRVLFPRAELRQRLVIDSDRSAVAIAREGFLIHDPFGQDESFRRLAAETIVRDGTGRVLAVDRRTSWARRSDSRNGARMAGSPSSARRSVWTSEMAICGPGRRPRADRGSIRGSVPVAVRRRGSACAWPPETARGCGAGCRPAWMSARRLLTGAAPPSRRKVAGGAMPGLSSQRPALPGACRSP